MASTAVQVVVVVLLVVVNTRVSFAARESFSGEAERDDWSWLSTPPYTPPVSFEHYPEVGTPTQQRVCPLTSARCLSLFHRPN